MANHYVSWVPDAHVRFGNLDFIVTTEGELAQAPIAVQPLHSAGLDAIAEALEELQLHAQIVLKDIWQVLDFIDDDNGD